MQKLVLILTITLTAIAANAQYSNYGGIDQFYEANPDLVGGASYAGRLVNPNYLLVDLNRFDEMDQRMLASGFVRLGGSSWECKHYINGYYQSSSGIPDRDSAIAFARSIGADIVIYCCHELDDRTATDHDVRFYAKEGSNTQVRRAAPINNSIPSNAVASLAMNRLQDFNHKPHVKGGVWYDAATDTFNWIGPKFGRRMSEPRTQFLSEIGPFLN